MTSATLAEQLSLVLANEAVWYNYAKYGDEETLTTVSRHFADKVFPGKVDKPTLYHAIAEALDYHELG